MKRDLLPWLIIGGILLLAGGTLVAVKLTRGVRNNNPGNIEKGIAWKGLAAAQGDVRFATFVHPKWGFRAIARILLGDFREGQNTVRSLIEEWSPPTDVFAGTSKPQNTGAYVAAVAKHLKVAPDAAINVPSYLPQLLDAIARHENSGYVYNPAIIKEGIALERTA